MKIWERYFLSETLKGLFFFLIAFGGLYVLIDYASHTGSSHTHHVKFSAADLSLFYLGELIRRSDVMIPFAILVATIRTLTSLNIHNELIALLAAGISMRRLMRPFLLIGLIGVLYLYINEEVLEPWSMKGAREISERHVVDQALKAENPSAHPVKLEDGTLLVFQNFDRSQNRFFDAWWIRSIDEIWRMETLTLPDQIQQEAPLAYNSDVFKRDSKGALILKESIKETRLPDMRFNQKRVLETITQPEDLSLSELSAKLDWSRTFDKDAESEKQARLKTALLRKILLPWLALLVVIGSAPLCLVFTRNLNVFFIFAVSLFGLVFFYLLINAGTTLADRQVFTPMVALFVPFAMIAFILTINWFKRV